MKTTIKTKELLTNYYKWLKDKTEWEFLKEDLVVITTPYLDRHNDYIQIYLYKEGSNYILSDDSWTIEHLEELGCILDSEIKQKLLARILSGFRVKKNNNEIYVKTNLEQFAMAKHNLIQAILAVNFYYDNIFYLRFR